MTKQTNSIGTEGEILSPLTSPSHPTRAMTMGVSISSSTSPTDGDHAPYHPSSSMMPTSDTTSAADDHGLGHEHHHLHLHLHQNHHQHHHHHHHPPGPRSLRLQETDVVFGTKGNGRNQLFLKELERQSFRYRVMSKADKMELIQTIIRDWPGDFYVWKSGDGASGPGHLHDQHHDHEDHDDSDGSHHEKLTLIKASSTSTSSSSSSSSSSPNGTSSPSMSPDKKLNESSCPIRLYTSVRRMMNYVITKHKQQPSSGGTSTGSTGGTNATANKGLLTKADVAADVAHGARAAGPASANQKKMKDSKKRGAKQITGSTTASSSGAAAATAAVKKSNQARKSKKLKAVSPKKATASPSPFEVGGAAMAADMIHKKTTKKVKRVVNTKTKKKTKVKAPKTLKIDASKHHNFRGGSLKIQSHDVVSSPRTTTTTMIAGPSGGGGKATTTMAESVAIVSPEPSPRGIHVPLNIGMRPQQLQQQHEHHQSDQSFSGIIPMLQPYGITATDIDGSDSLGCQFASSTTLWSHGNKTNKKNINAKKKKKTTTTTTKRKSKTSSLHHRSNVANKPSKNNNDTLYMRSLEDEAISTLISFRRTSYS